MSFLSRLFGPKAPEDPVERERLATRLDGKRRHLRSKLAQNQGELKRLWTQFRLAPKDERAPLKAKIKVCEASRKVLVKEMLALQSEMKKLGFEAKAGHVEMH